MGVVLEPVDALVVVAEVTAVEVMGVPADPHPEIRAAAAENDATRTDLERRALRESNWNLQKTSWRLRKHLLCLYRVRGLDVTLKNTEASVNATEMLLEHYC